MISNFSDDQIARNDLPNDVFGLLHDLAYDQTERVRAGYQARAQELLRAETKPETRTVRWFAERLEAELRAKPDQGYRLIYETICAVWRAAGPPSKTWTEQQIRRAFADVFKGARDMYFGALESEDTPDYLYSVNYFFELLRKSTPEAVVQPAQDLHGVRDWAERTLIMSTLEKYGWHRKRAAKDLGISYRGLLYKMKNFKIVRV